MRTLYVPLPDGAVDRLTELARREYREPKAQASVLILEGLRRAGLDPDVRAAEAEILAAGDLPAEPVR